MCPAGICQPLRLTTTEDLLHRHHHLHFDLNPNHNNNLGRTQPLDMDNYDMTTMDLDSMVPHNHRRACRTLSPALMFLLDHSTVNNGYLSLKRLRT